MPLSSDADFQRMSIASTEVIYGVVSFINHEHRDEPIRRELDSLCLEPLVEIRELDAKEHSQRSRHNVKLLLQHQQWTDTFFHTEYRLKIKFLQI